MNRKAEIIYDESGIEIGIALPISIGEPRPEQELTDIDLDILDADVLPESGLSPDHNPFTYRIEEANTIIERNDFVMRYLAAKEKCPSLLQ